jgi:hypothetical protein
MFRFTTLFPAPRYKKRKLIRELRRLVHQRNYWRNRSLERSGRRRKR